jgi:hypothetical protein
MAGRVQRPMIGGTPTMADTPCSRAPLRPTPQGRPSHPITTTHAGAQTTSSGLATDAVRLRKGGPSIHDRPPRCGVVRQLPTEITIIRQSVRLSVQSDFVPVSLAYPKKRRRTSGEVGFNGNRRRARASVALPLCLPSRLMYTKKHLKSLVGIRKTAANECSENKCDRNQVDDLCHDSPFDALQPAS